MGWSKQQEKAIELVGKNVLVCASAGAGKTTVLIARLMKRITIDRIGVNEILAMTFTEAAAAEMKKRLSVSLNTEYEKTKDPFLYTQISLLPSAQISTIHSFCLSVIKNYSYVLGLDPKRCTNILDEATSSLYKKQALQQVLNDVYQENPDELSDLLGHFSGRPEDDEGLRSAIKKMSIVLSSKTDPETWANQKCAAYTTMNSLSDLAEPYRSAFFVTLHLKLEDLNSAVNDYKSYIEQNYPDQAKHLGELRFIEVRIRLAEDALAKFDYDTFRAEMMECAHAGFTRSFNSKDKNIQLYRKGLTDTLQSKVFPNLFDQPQFLTDIALMGPRLSLLVKLTLNYRHVMQQIKEKQQCLDFDDMEHFALAILSHPDFDVADQYRQLFKEILVDEFQDSNDVQNTIVDLMSRGNNVFRVGDIKQSIYRFRNAKPQLMQGLVEKQGESDEVIYLGQNYRSSQTIVEFNNLFFNEAMNVTGLSSHYLPEDTVTIGTDSQSGGLPVEIHLLIDEENEIGGDETDENDETKPIVQEESLSSAQLKARHIASTIVKLHTEGTFNHWRDYVILVRSHALKRTLKKAFDEANIPYFIDVKSGFYQSDSVQDMLMMMHYCLDPEQVQSLVGLLLSPFFNFSEQQLALLQLDRQPRESFVSSFNRTYPELAASLRDLRLASSRLALTDFLRLCFDFNDYYETAVDRQQRTNLDLLRDKAVSFDQKHVTLIQFIQLIEEIKEESSSEAIPISNEDDVVRVMTIHQSKGLQFNVVFFWSSLRQSVLDLGDPLLTDPDLGFALKTVELPERYVRTNPMRMALETKSVQDEMEEQMRVLYVALTRPQKLLIIVDNAPSEKKNIQSPLTRSMIFNKIGTTGWLISVLKPLDSELFKLSYIFPEPKISEPIQEVSASGKFIAPIRTDEAVVWRSPTESHAFKPTFTLNYNAGLIGKSRGTRLHKLIQTLPNGGWDQALIQNVDPECTPEEVRQLMSFNQSDWYRRMSQNTLYKEFPFILRKNNEFLSGIMDMVSIGEDEILLVDFKTDIGLSPQQLLDNYRAQITDYAASLKFMYPTHHISCALYSFQHEKILTY